MKYNRKTNRWGRRCLGVQLDRRGSAIILVLVTIVLIAILATTLIQITRFERIAKADSDIEAVISSVVDAILSQATDDLIDADGNMFNIIASANNANSAGDEPWDFPFTRNANYGRQAEQIDGTNVNVLGGIADDAWIASSAPDFRTVGTGATQVNSSSSLYASVTPNTTLGLWRHITDISGQYVTNATGGSDLSASAQPSEQPITNLAFKTNLTATRADAAGSVLVDADGDGIGDSKWEWAPLRQIGTTRYVMAVRVIDLSARIDLNVATGVGSTNNNAARGDGPTELNGTFAVGTIGTGASVAAATATNEWNKLLQFRLTGNGSTALASILSYDNQRATPTSASRRHYWDNGASLVGPDFARNGKTGTGYDFTNTSTATIDDAFELLHRNGLNNAASTPLEVLMPNLLRNAAGEEDNFVTTGTTVTANNWTLRQFWELDPRKMYSAFTGSMAVSRHPSTTYAAQPGTYKFNLNWNRDNNKYFQWISSALRNRWMNVASPSGSSSLRSLFPHLNGRTEYLPNQLAVNIADYSDRDNRITIANNRAGFEALPYITEVYTQRPYDVRTLAVDPMTGEINVTWEPINNSTFGYAIEIGNPFAQRVGGSWVGRSISLENIWLKMGNTSVLLSSLTGMPSELGPGEVVIVTRDSTGGNATLDDVSARWATPSGNLSIAAVVSGPAMPLFPSLFISLHGMAQGTSTSALAWYYNACLIEAGNATISETLPATSTIVVGSQSYVQTGYQGVGDELRMMTVMPQPQSSNARGYGDDTASLNSPSINHNAGAPDLDGTGTIPPEFTEETKSGEPTGFAALDGQQIVWHDNPRNYPNDGSAPEDGRLMWTGDLLQIPLIGPDYRAGNAFDRTMATAFYNAGLQSNAAGVDALLLPYKSTAPKMNTDTSTAIGGTFGLFNIPHSLMLLEQVAVNQPATDREDGDGDGYNERRFDNTPQPDMDEMLIAGRINLNTASQATLERVLPFPSAALRTNIAAAIVKRRESITQQTDWGIGANGVPGIQYVGSLYEQVATVGSNPAGDGLDTDTISGVPVDHNNYEAVTAGAIVPSALADGVADDREEELMLAKWLTEIADVRSDVFAAYIIVQGYRADDFRQGAQESARLIVIFSRANVHGPGDKAIEIARFRIE